MAIGEIMGILNRPIEMIAFHTADGDDISFVKVDRIIDWTREKFLGREVIRFNCVSTMNGAEKRYELVFYPDVTRWQLYKI